MNPISKLLNKGKPELSPDAKQAYLAEGARSELMSNNETDFAWKNLNAFRYEVIHDEDTEAVLAEKVLPKILVPKFDDKTGNLEYEKDSEGNTLLDGNGHPIIKYVQGFQVDNFYAALMNMNSHKNRLVFLDPKDKRLHQLLTEDIIEDVKTNNPESKFDSGEGAYLNSLLDERFLLLNDCSNGNKVKAMLEIRKTTSLDMNLRQQEKKPGAGIF